MHSPSIPARAFAACTVLAALACGGPHHHLDEYSFANRSLAVVPVGQPSPGLLTSGYDLHADDDAIGAVVKAGAGVAKDLEARKARARLDSATARLDIPTELGKRTLERTSRYLGLRPTGSEGDADFLLEIHLHNFGLDARGTSAASLYTNAEAVLLERRTGREIWNVKVHGTDRLTPRVRGASGVPGTIIAAGTLRGVTVAEFQDALDQLVTLSSNVIADELRSSLRDVRRR